MSINPERLAFALRQTGANHGMAFEEFANAFLAAELPNLQPVGGMHDGGADGIIYCSDSAPTTFVQSSVTSDPVKKIRKTKKRLTEAGKNCREMIYCSPRAIVKETENVAAELRKGGISLLVRDETYFTTFCNTNSGRVAASENYFGKIAAPILAPAHLAKSQEIQLTSDEEKLLLTYFDVTFEGSDPEKSILTTCYETMVTYCLRETSAEKSITKEAIACCARTICQHENDVVFQQRIEGALTKLRGKGIVKYRSDIDAYHLAHIEQERTAAELLSLHGRMESAVREIENFTTEVRNKLSVATPVEPRLLLAIINAVICTQSQAATSALTSGRFSTGADEQLRKIVSEKIGATGAADEKQQQADVDFFVIVVESIFQRPPPSIATYFRNVANAYFLFFLMRQPTDIQDALRKVVGSSRIVVDASVIIPCLAEYAFAADLRIRQNLMRAAVDAGASLFVTEVGIAEIVSHMSKARAIYERIVRGESHYGRSALVDAYFSGTNTKFDTFYKFLDYFTGSDAAHDMKELLRLEFCINVAELAPLAETARERIQRLIAVWRALRPKPTALDEDDFTILVENDVRTYLHLQAERARQKSDEKRYGESWWWLTEDSTAHSIDRSESGAGATTICMNPDYLLRYVSVAPRARAVNTSNQLSPLPISIELAGLGLIPEEIVKASAKQANVEEDDPPFRRQMKLRTYINQCRSLTS